MQTRSLCVIRWRRSAEQQGRHHQQIVVPRHRRVSIEHPTGEFTVELETESKNNHV